MPRLSPAKPATTIKEFVLNALRIEGASINISDDGSYAVESASLGNERITFDETIWRKLTQPGVFLVREPHLYQPGRPAFERLVQRWSDHSAALVRDDRATSHKQLDVARTWLEDVPGASLVDVRISSRIEKFSGKALCRVRASNAVDSYEKLLKTKVQYQGEPAQKRIELMESFSVRRFVPGMDAKIEDAVKSDPDIGKFIEYYSRRLEAELDNSDAAERQKKLISDLQPTLIADIAGVEGRITELVEISVKYRFAGDVEYESKIRLDGEKVCGEPRRIGCAITGNILPVDCLEKCGATGKRALKELLRKSEGNGELALPDEFVLCSVSQKEVHKGETDICSITGARVLKGSLLKSEMSGKLVLPECLKRCEITGVYVLESELCRSDVSGKRFRSDEAVLLAGSDKQAHKTEAFQCTYSSQWYANGDRETSDVTGQPMGNDRIAYSEVSRKKCDISEIAVCELSKMKLLPCETGRCSISGKVVRNDLLATCPETKTLALPETFEKCEETGVSVVPACLEKCQITGKRVRRSHLKASDVSRGYGIARLMIRCCLSNAILLPDETGQCEVTGRRIDKLKLKPCSVSGKRVIPGELIASAVSGELMLPQYAIKLPNDVIAGKHEVVFCIWSNQYISAGESGTCALTQLPVARTFLNADGELGVFRDCLDGKISGHEFMDASYLEKFWPEQFHGVYGFQFVSSPSGTAHIFFGTKSFLSFLDIGAKTFGVVVRGTRTQMKICGKVAIGRRVKGKWQAIPGATKV